MKTVSIHDAKTNLSKYITAVKRGETIYIGSHGKPEVRIVVELPPKPKRKFGTLKGKIPADINLEEIDRSPEWQEVVRAMNDDPLSHE